MPFVSKKKVYKPRRKVYGRKLNPRQKTEVKRLIGNRTETKYLDFSIASSVIDTGIIVSMVGPPQGIRDTERVGDSILLKKLMLNLTIAGADTTNTFRLIILRWALNSATSFPLVTDILQNTNANSLYNYDQYQQGKFHVVYDRNFVFTYTGKNNIQVRTSLWGKKLGRKKLQFNEAATTGLHQFFMLAITNSSAVPHPTIDGFMRLEYTDA